MCAVQPSLEQKNNKMDARHDFMSRVRTATDHGDLMLVARRRKPGIAFPWVGMDHRPRHHGTPDEGKQAVSGDIPDAPKAYAAGASTVLLYGHPTIHLLVFSTRLRLTHGPDTSAIFTLRTIGSR